MIDSFKKMVERLFHCRIYRNSFPHGTDLAHDLNRAFGRDSIRTVFDVGAHTGEMALVYADMFPRATIYSFEPVDANFRELQRTIGGNPRLRAYPLGMGREPGSASIHLGEGLSTTNSIVHNASGSDRTETIQIESVSHFAEQEKIATIDFLKIDTEGYELEVLAGAEPLLREQQVRLIYVECEPMETKNCFTPYARLAEFMGRHGYELFGIYDQVGHWQPEKEPGLYYFNAVFLCPELAHKPGAAPAR